MTARDSSRGYTKYQLIKLAKLENEITKSDSVLTNAPKWPVWWVESFIEEVRKTEEVAS